MYILGVKNNLKLNYAFHFIPAYICKCMFMLFDELGELLCY